MKNLSIYFLIISFILLTGCNNKENNAIIDSKQANTSNPSYNINRLNSEFIPKDYEESTTLLTSFSTNILTNDDNRYNNIKIVSDRLNNYVLEPGEEFSFNNICGPYGKDDGFLEATILLSDGTEDKGYGGGVCQLSSTLYNAVNNLNLEITEHHHHSTPVAYVPANQDATVSLQSNLDFKFKNTLEYPIKFRTLYDPNNLTVFIDRA